MKTGMTEASARACANIALAKYWGKSDVSRNVPAVPSISLTLDQLVTETQVRFDPSLKSDVVRLDGRRASPEETTRVVDMLDRVRREAGLPTVAVGLITEARQAEEIVASGRADLVLFIFREEVYKPDDETVKNMASIIIGKQRNGPIGQFDLHFHKEFTRFADLAR